MASNPEALSSMPSHIQPQGFAATIMGLTILLSILCLLAVSLRLWVRIRDHCFYNEDGFMVAGLVSFVLSCLRNGPDPVCSMFTCHIKKKKIIG